MSGRRTRGSVLIAGILLGIITVPANAQTAETTPPCFHEDTVYHAVLDLSRNTVNFVYGQYPLVACPFTYGDDPEEAADFAERWRSRPTPWQSITARTVLRGHPAISDTVVEVVSRVANVNPDLIRRIQPERFSVDLTSQFRLLIRVADSTAGERSFREFMESVSRWVFSLGKAKTLDVVVSPQDAQTLYYAFEPGAPILLISPKSAESTPQD